MVQGQLDYTYKTADRSQHYLHRYTQLLDNCWITLNHHNGLIFFFLIQFNVPFKIISLIETSQSIGGAKREYPGKTT